ncbi:MAG: hypothetical protein U0232_26165 [Thermomicrobiales bacterium]
MPMGRFTKRPYDCPDRQDQSASPGSPPAPVASRTARRIARSSTSSAAAASVASANGSMVPGRVESAKIVSPSNGVWQGRMARAKASCPFCASR